MDTKNDINNGRVSDAEKVSNYRKLEEDILYNNQRDDALKGILERSRLSNIFLSPESLIAPFEKFACIPDPFQSPLIGFG